MADNRMDEILTAALALFSKKGYLKTSITDVAEAVGVTKGGIYHYISNKEELLFLIHKQMVDAFLDAFQVSSASDADPEQKLFDWVHAHLVLMRDYKAHIKIFFNELYNLENQSYLDRIVGSRDAIFTMLHGIVKEGIKTKTFRSDINPKVLTFLLFGMLNWLYQWYDPAGPRTIEKIYEDVIKFISGGIVRPDSASK